MPTVLVTGANRGIGLEFARQYAADGWKVIATARETSPELDSLGVSIETLDMRDLDAVTAIGGRIDDAIDLLVASAGTWMPETAETAEDGRAWAEMLTVNSIAPYLLAKSILPRIPRGGKLIAITSGMGSIAESSGGYVPYRTSKAALNMAWHSLAIEMKRPGIIASVLDPGWVRTRMGGPSAPTPPEQSVGDMRRLIDSMGAELSGGFYKRDGTPEPW